MVAATVVCPYTVVAPSQLSRLMAGSPRMLCRSSPAVNGQMTDETQKTATVLSLRATSRQQPIHNTVSLRTVTIELRILIKPLPN